MEDFRDLTDAEILAMMEADFAAETRREDDRFALDEWLRIYHVIMGCGGVLTSSITEDYAELPTCVRRKAGLPIDSVAAHFDIGYADEFVAYVRTAWQAWRDSSDGQRPRYGTGKIRRRSKLEIITTQA